MSEDKKEKIEVQGRYVPVKPIDPNEVSVNEYLFDTNSILTSIDNSLKLLIQILAKKDEPVQKKGVRTIGITK